MSSDEGDDRHGLQGADHYFSPSQIENFDTCQRKWVFKSLLRLEAPQARSAALGDAVHAELERYYKGGDIEFTSEAGYIAEAALKHLPPPGEFIKPERKWSLLWKGNHYLGRVDLTDESGHAAGLIKIIDHKTTKDLKWAKTVGQLMTDPQAMLYGLEAMAHYELPKVTLFWNYVTTAKPYKTQPTLVEVSSAHVVEQCNRIRENSVIPMMQLIPAHKLKKELVANEDDATRVLSVKPNPEACDAYGGCPFKSRCRDLGATQRVGALMNQKIQDMIKAKKAAAAAKKAADPVNPPDEEKAPESEKAPASEKPEPAAEASEPVVRKPGRPPGAKNKPKDPVDPKASQKTLLVGCIPIKGGQEAVTNSLRLIEDAHTGVREGLEVEDFRLAEFGKGKGALIVELRTRFLSGEYGNVICTGTHTGSDLSNCLIEALSAHVDLIVSGVG